VEESVAESRVVDMWNVYSPNHSVGQRHTHGRNKTQSKTTVSVNATHTGAIRPSPKQVSVNVTHTGAIRPSPKQQDETVREQNTSPEITHNK
jgi:hypothetical protein